MDSETFILYPRYYSYDFKWNMLWSHRKFIIINSRKILSGTLVYLFSRSFTNNKVKRFLDNQYPAFNDLLATYIYKFLALGMICPIAPTDIICFLSASVGIKYSTYILTIIIANTPLRMLYSFVGISLLESKLGKALVIITFVLVATISIKVWTTLKQKPEQKNCRNSC